MFVINRKKIFVTISAILAIVSLVLISFFGLDLSIEFTGGSIIEAEYPVEDRPDKETLQINFDNLEIGGYTLQPIEDTGYVLRTAFLETDQTESVRQVFQSGGAEITREAAIGPSVGQELRTKAIAAIIIVSIGIISFIAFAFRRVSRPVESWKYGLVAIVALIHDILLPTGVFALLGYFLGFEVDLLFVMGLLVILGYSVNDTIVVFDRTRENLMRLQDGNDATNVINGEVVSPNSSFAKVVGLSLEQTYARSLNTSLTTLVVLVCLYIFGGEATNHFALMLIVGIISGTYSSIFLASPLLVILAKDASVQIDEDAKVKPQTREERRANLVDPGLEM